MGLDKMIRTLGKKRMVEFMGRHYEVKRKLQYDPVNEDNYTLVLCDVVTKEEVSANIYFLD